MIIDWIGCSENNYTKGRGGKTINKIVLHWIVGTLESADATFKNPDRQASAHYGVADEAVHQYVQEQDTAWHAGNWSANQESIGIEHEGGWVQSDGTRKTPTDHTLRTSAELVARIAQKYNIPLDKDHILPHNHFKATQCPGSLNIDYIIQRARELNAPKPEVPDVITDEKQKLDLKGDYGVKTLKETRNIIDVLDNNLDQLEKRSDEQITDLIEEHADDILQLEKAHAEQMRKYSDKVAQLMDKQAENLSWDTLFIIGIAKLKLALKGGENNV